MKILVALKEKAKSLRNEIFAIFLAFKHKRTPVYAKVFIALTISYAVSPVDLIPDFIPVLGYLDDLILLPLMLSLSIKLIPVDVLRECRRQAEGSVQIKKSLGIPAAMAVVVIWAGILGYILYRTG